MTDNAVGLTPGRLQKSPTNLNNENYLVSVGGPAAYEADSSVALHEIPSLSTAQPLQQMVDSEAAPLN